MMALFSSLVHPDAFDMLGQDCWIDAHFGQVLISSAPGTRRARGAA